MAKQSVLLLLCLALSCVSTKPRDLADEAEKQLQELSTLVQGQILAAHSKLDELNSEFSTYSNNVNLEAQTNLDQELETIESQVSTLVDLAASSGYDVSTCTNNREDALQQLSDDFKLYIYRCLYSVMLDVGDRITDATYVVDVIMTKIHDLQSQLQRCRGDISCISALVTKMELLKISLVQDIEKEVQTTEDQVSLWEVDLETCSDSNLADFVAQANSILGDITACIERIIG